MRPRSVRRRFRACRARGPTRWGDWTLNRRAWVLTHAEAPWYEIDLERMRTSAELLDWIFQVRTLGWMTPQAMADLLAAIDDIISPQSTLCSWGCSKQINNILELLESRFEGRAVAARRSRCGKHPCETR